MTTLVLLVRKESNTRPPVRPKQFSWVFFLRTKDETSAILKDFIRQIENQLNQKVKTIRSDNGIEFKNKDVIEFCGSKGIKREYSNARTPQQNGVAERKNRTLIEAARTMLADSFLPNTFWAEAVSTACYVLNRVLVTKPHNKTPYELLTGKIPIISYIRPFGCHVTILNTIDHLGKFAGKSDEGFLVGYSLQSKAFRVYNLETKRVEENLHINFLENKPNVAGKGPTWLFDLDYLTDSMNYHPIRSENQANHHAGQQEANQNAGTEDIIEAGDSEQEDESAQDCFVLPIWPSYSSTITPDLKTDEKRDGPREEEQVFMDELERLKRQEKEANEEAEALRKKFEHLVIKEGVTKASSTNLVNTVSIPVSTASPHEGLSLSDPTNPEEDDSEIPPLEDIYQNTTDGIFTTSSYDDEGAVADFTNLETVVNVSPIPTSRIHSSHPTALILGDPNSAVQTRSKLHKSSGAHAFVSYVQKQRRNNHKDFQHCLFACFLSQHEPKKISEALEDESWVDAMQEELLQFEIQKVWILVDLPFGKKAIGTKWVYRNKKDERGVVVRNKARLVAQGHRQDECIDYDEIVQWENSLSFLDLQVKTKEDGILISQIIVLVSMVSGHSKFVHLSAVKSNFRVQFLVVTNESLRRVIDGIEALQLPTLFILWLDKVSTDSAKLVPLGKVCTAIKTLKKNTARYKALISLFTTISLSSTMAVLDSRLKHNMVAYLEKSEGNAEFQEIIDFLKRSSIHHALTDEGVSSERPTEAQPTPSPAPTSEVPHEPQTDSSPAHISEVPLEHQTHPSPRPSPTTTIPILSRNFWWESRSHSSVINPFQLMRVGTTLQMSMIFSIFMCTVLKNEIATQATQTSTQTPTSTIFGDDETIAKVLLNMSQAKAVSREKEKCGKKKIEEEDESESESDGIPDAEKKFKQLESDEEMARKIQEEWEAEEERNRIAEEKAANEALIRNFDDIKARIEADRLLAEKLQEQEREQFTIEERAEFLHDTIAAQRKFLAQQRSEAIRNRPPTKNQLRNQMMTYLKHVGNFKHAELKIKKFEEVQALYEKIKRSDEDFISIGSAEDERLIKRMNEKGVDSSKSEVLKEESKEEVQEESKEEENEEKEVDYEILDRKYPIKEWKTECLGTKPQTNQAEDFEEINQNVVIRSNGQKRYFSTLMRVLFLFDREDLNAGINSRLDNSELEVAYSSGQSEEDSTMALELIIYQEDTCELELKDKD
ncbi:putative ribonuclease H-like domain-containing protein [Tanacetum coccineum]